jgi:SAM-dependent methyltransferase
VSDDRRSRIWWEIWNRRSPELVEFNGAEACFSDFPSYKSFIMHEAAFVRDTLQLDGTHRVLDLGCGTGLLSSFIAPTVRSVVALDYSEDALEVARTQRPRANVEYQRADLTSLDTSAFDVDKAYAVGVLHYLDSYEAVREMLLSLTTRGVDVLVVDVPDENARALVTRHYDMEKYSHLYFDEKRLRADFDGVTIYRGLFPEYSNDSVRFSFHLPSSTG